MNKAVNIVFSGRVFLPFLVFIILFLGVFSVRAQETKIAPEMSVAGIRLNDEASAKAFLGNYSARRDQKTRPVYFFYNDEGTEVLKLTAFSEAKPFLLVAAEVFSVGESYQDRHYVLQDRSVFPTESGFYVGEHQSAKSLLFAVREITRPGSLVKKKGKPSEDVKEEKKETITYNFDENAFSTTDEKMKIANYTAVYEFRNKMLKRFKFEIELVPKK